MKNKIFAMILFCATFTQVFAQKYYDGQWKKVIENYHSGQYKSNLPIILDIQKQAMKEENAIQLIRSLKAEFSIINQTYDDTQNDSSTKFFSKLQGLDKNLKGDDRLVFDVLLGEFFSDFYHRSQWEINQRTNINNQDLSQIETWSKLDFKNYLGKHFSALNTKSGDLKKVPMSKYKTIFEETEDLDYFPTLFDWNAMKEIDFLSNSQLFTPNELKENQPKIGGIYSELIAKNEGNSKLYFQHQKLNDDCAISKCKDKIQQLQNLVKSPVKGDYKVLVIAEIIDQLTADQKYSEALVLIKNTKQEYANSTFINSI